MQVFGLPGHVIRSAKLASRLIDAETPNIAAAIRRDALSRWRQARQNGLNAEAAARAVGVPRSTLYRWSSEPEPKSRKPHRPRQPAWSRSLVEAVEALRADNPMWGKSKLVVLLRRDGFQASASTVGRILKRLVDRGAVTPVPVLRKKSGRCRFRVIGKAHARRLPKGLKPTRPGAIVQLDTLFITQSAGKTHKHFTAYDPVAKWTVAGIASRATATCAARFLDKLLAQMPFKVAGIQVDGGSEFMAEFEQACQARKLALYVLPPKRPQLNGAVERCNGSWRYEFYASYELPHRLDELEPLIDAFAHRYNHHRPHGALDGLTPAEYLSTISQAAAPSHIC
jgi:putative transposase